MIQAPRRGRSVAILAFLVATGPWVCAVAQETSGGGAAAGSSSAAGDRSAARSGAGSGTSSQDNVSTGSQRTGTRGWGTFSNKLPELGREGIDPPMFTPGVRTSLTLSDNLMYRPPGQERPGLLLEASPYLSARSEAPNAKYQLDYQLRNFMRMGSNSDITLLRHNLRGHGSFALAGDNLWLDLGAFMGRVNATPYGPMSIDPTTNFINSTPYRRFTVAPWYRDTLGDFAAYKLRYEVAHTSGPTSIYIAPWQHRGSASIDGIERGRRWNWHWSGDFTSNRYDGGFTRDRRFSSGTLSYRYSDALEVHGGYVYEQIDGVVDKDGRRYGYGPTVGFRWEPLRRIHLSADVSDRYYGTVGSAKATWTAARHTLGANWSRSVMMGTDPAMLSLDPMSLTSMALGTDNNFVNQLLARGILIPDGMPIARSWVTDSAMMYRRVNVFWAFRAVHGVLMATLYTADRESLTTFDTRALGGIRGSGTASSMTFEGTILERGFSLHYTHYLDGRVRLENTLDRRQVESPTAGFRNQFTTLRVGIVGQATPTVSAFAGARITRQDAQGRLGSKYDEHAIYGGVDMRF